MAVRGKMLENSGDLMSIVVLEAGAAWPPWLTDYQRLAPNAVVIAQATSEASEVFQRRVMARVKEAAQSGGLRLRVGVIVASEQPGHDRSLLRQNVARALVTAMDKTHEAELVLAGDGEELEASRHELFALAGSLCEELGGAHINVRVRFTHGRSGVIQAVPGPGAPLEASNAAARGR